EQASLNTLQSVYRSLTLDIDITLLLLKRTEGLARSWPFFFAVTSLLAQHRREPRPGHHNPPTKPHAGDRSPARQPISRLHVQSQNRCRLRHAQHLGGKFTFAHVLLHHQKSVSRHALFCRLLYAGTQFCQGYKW